MSVTLHTGVETILDDVIETDEADEISVDTATRKMMVRASSESLARASISIASALPSESNMFCARRRVSSLVCGSLYELNAEYKGLLGDKEEDIRVQDHLESWDSGTMRLIVRAASAAVARTEVDLGDSLPGFANMVCIDRDAEVIVPGKVYMAIANFKGIASIKPAKYVPRTFADKQSTPSGLYPGQATMVPLDSFQPMVGMTVYWYSTTVPSMSVAGTNVTPAEAPSVPASVWSSIDNPVHTYPYGWVLDDRTIDRIAGTTLCFVTDAYSYYHRYKP